MALSSKTIVSVYFRSLTATRPYKPIDNSRGYNSTFHIDACKRGEFKTLKVIDHAERSYVGQKQWTDIPVPCDGINGLANDLVNEWSKQCLHGNMGGPGVLVCAGEEPTSEEIDACVAQQTRWADYICTKAEEEWINGRKTNIGDVERDAARWLGRDAEYEWVSDRGTFRNIACPLCSKPVSASAVVCPHCSNVINFERYQEYLSKMEAIKSRATDSSKASPLPPPIKNPQQPQHQRT